MFRVLCAAPQIDASRYQLVSRHRVTQKERLFRRQLFVRRFVDPFEISVVCLIDSSQWDAVSDTVVVQYGSDIQVGIYNWKDTEEYSQLKCSLRIGHIIHLISDSLFVQYGSDIADVNRYHCIAMYTRMADIIPTIICHKCLISA